MQLSPGGQWIVIAWKRAYVGARFGWKMGYGNRARFRGIIFPIGSSRSDLPAIMNFETTCVAWAFPLQTTVFLHLVVSETECMNIMYSKVSRNPVWGELFLLGEHRYKRVVLAVYPHLHNGFGTLQHRRGWGEHALPQKGAY